MLSPTEYVANLARFPRLSQPIEWDSLLTVDEAVALSGYDAVDADDLRRMSASGAAARAGGAWLCCEKENYVVYKSIERAALDREAVAGSPEMVKGRLIVRNGALWFGVDSGFDHSVRLATVTE